MAMNIISKEKKEIKWVGLPTNSAQECQQLEVEMTVEYVVLISKLVKVDCEVLLTQIFVFYRRKRKKDKKE